MTGLILTGAGLGLGAAVLLSGLAPARPPLAAAIAALRTQPLRLDRRQWLVRGLATPLVQAGLPRRRMLADLAILDRHPHHYLAAQLGLAMLGLLTPPATVALLNVMGAGISWGVPLWLGAALAAGAFAVGELSLHEQAEQRRLLMRHTLAALLDVIPPALAAGAGIEQALTDASSIAEGWAARQIRAAITTARTHRTPLWQPLRELG